MAYRRLCGGVSVNYHGLSDFRFDQAAILDRLLTESLTALLAEGVVKLAEIAIDGTKARANAGKVRSGGRTSWRDWKNWPVSWSRNLRRRRRATRRRARTGGKRRAARDIARRVAEARRALDELRAAKATRAKTHKTDKAEKGEIRVSTTDPEARMIRFSDGAMRTGYNVQLAVEPGLRHHSGKSDQRPTE